MTDKPMSVADARAAWEADKHNVKTALAYAQRLAAAVMLGQLTMEEFATAVEPLKLPAEQMLRDRVGDAGLAEADKLFKAGLDPKEIAAKIAHLDKDRPKHRAEAVAWASSLLGSKEKAEFLRQLFEAGVPHEIAAAAVAAMSQGGQGPVIQVISVGADGVATVHDLSSDENDGIGPTVGNA